MSETNEAVVILKGQLPYLQEVVALLDTRGLHSEIVQPEDCSLNS